MLHDTSKPWLRMVVGATIGLGAIVVIGALALHFVPKWLASNGLGPQDTAEELGRTRTATLAFLAGVVASIGAVYTARTFGLSRSAQMTERFTHAIDQLGNEEADVRIGSIYALERIARDSPRDHQAVMEVLTAFIRDRVRDSSKPTIPPDVQAALTVVGRRQHTNDPAGFRINLEGADLRYANLARARLERAVLNGAQLQGAVLAEAFLTETWLIEAYLEGASLIGAHMRDAKLGNARLERAVLYEADLSGARLSGAHLDFALFGDSTPPGNPETSVIMHGASLRAVSMTVRVLPARFGHKSGPANLSGIQLDNARYTPETKWPPGFVPESCGAQLVTTSKL
jgi:uncharacterized protein YjbI with pentapeptide repeats